MVKNAGNFLAIEVNYTRTVDAIPAMAFDWWNYGGITRDVMLVSTPKIFIEDYFIQLDKYKADKVNANIRLSEKTANANIELEIPELKIKQSLKTDNEGIAQATINVKKIERWSPESPKLYKVIISSATDKIEEMIGFRNIWVEGENIYLTINLYF